MVPLCCLSLPIIHAIFFSFINPLLYHVITVKNPANSLIATKGTKKGPLF
jgi:hypothetical protein